MQFDGTKIEDKSTMKLSFPLLLTTLGVSYAFTTSSVSTCTRNVQLSAKTDEQSRRSFVSAAIAVGASTIFAGPAFSDVSDGNTLPQGAAQFSRLLKVKNDLQVIEKRVAEKSSEIDKKEWDNIGGFIRRLYAAGDDMKDVAKGIYDPEKKLKAAEDIKQLQKYAKAAEGPVNKQDGDTFVGIMKKCEEIIDDFFELLRDVPDEI